ncbi:MAG: PTPDL family protein [Verrucomicrobiota bacterium]
MKNRLLLPLATAWVCLLGSALADTVVTKDGQSFQGKVLSDTEAYVVLRMEIGSGIVTEKRIPKTEVASIDRDSPAKKALSRLNSLLPTQDLLTAEQYDRLLQEVVEPAVAETTGTDLQAQAEEIASELRAEASKAREGQIRFNGIWFGPKGRALYQQEIAAGRLLAGMKEALQSKRWLQALRIYERLEGEYLLTQSYGEALRSLSPALRGLLGEIKQQLQLLPLKLQEQRKGLEAMTPAERSRTEDAIAQEMARFEATLEREEASGTRWLSSHYLDEKSLGDSEETILDEADRLKALDRESLAQTSEQLSAALAALSAGSPQLAADKLEAVSKSFHKHPQFLFVEEQIEAAFSQAPEPPTEATSQEAAAPEEKEAESSPASPDSQGDAAEGA